MMVTAGRSGLRERETVVPDDLLPEACNAHCDLMLSYPHLCPILSQLNYR